MGAALAALDMGAVLGLGWGSALALSFAFVFDDSAQLVLAEELLIDPHRCADEPQLLGARPGADLHVPASNEERVQGAVGFVQLR